MEKEKGNNMIVSYCDYNADNKIFCRYKNRDISRFANSLEELQALFKEKGYNLTVYEGLDLDSSILNSLDAKELRDYNCNNTEYLMLSSHKMISNQF